MMTMGKRNFIEGIRGVWGGEPRSVCNRDGPIRIAHNAGHKHEEGTMAESTVWWLLAGAGVAVELVTGTFYLLMVASGLAAGALAAHVGAQMPIQLVTAAVVGGGAVAAW